MRRMQESRQFAAVCTCEGHVRLKCATPGPAAATNSSVSELLCTFIARPRRGQPVKTNEGCLTFSSPCISPAQEKKHNATFSPSNMAQFASHNHLFMVGWKLFWKTIESHNSSEAGPGRILSEPRA